jgi:hypothetical protein
MLLEFQEMMSSFIVHNAGNGQQLPIETCFPAVCNEVMFKIF